MTSDRATFDRGEALDRIEAFLGGASTDITKWTLKGRPISVLARHHTPRPGVTSYVAFDALYAQWPALPEDHRILPVIASSDASDPRGDAGFHVAMMFDWALRKGVPPAAGEVILTLGHEPTLPHFRYGEAPSWPDGPWTIGPLTVRVVLGYSIGQAEARYQHALGARALDAALSEVDLFDRARVPRDLPLASD